MRDKEIIDTNFFTTGLQNFEKYDVLSPIEIKIDKDRLLRNLQKYLKKNYIYRFLVC